LISTNFDDLEWPYMTVRTILSLCCVEAYEDRPILSAQKIAPGLWSFDVQIVTTNLDFKGTPLFDFEYLWNDTR